MNSASMVTGPTVVVTWGMVSAIIAAIFVFLVVALFFLRWVVRDFLRMHLDGVTKQVNRVVALTDAADAQYKAVKSGLAATNARIDTLTATVDGHDAEIKMLRQKVGIPRTA